MRLTALIESIGKLSLVDLPYGYADLEPIMGKETVRFHYDVLSRGYVDRYNSGDGDPEFNRAGALLHNLFWPQLMKPKVNNMPFGTSKDFINLHFEDFDNFKDKFTETALSLQGSGWCYLASDGSIKLLKNQTWKSDILMPIDLWEHSYSPYSLRKDYLKTIWRLIDWSVINDRITTTS